MNPNRDTQRDERADVPTSGAPVAAPSTPSATQSLDEVVLIDELATILKTSRRTIERQLRAGTFFIPTMARVDTRHRWSRAVVSASIAESHTRLRAIRATKPYRLA